jgi:hypothetical protein
MYTPDFEESKEGQAKIILQFAQLLSPEIHMREDQVNIFFDVLYDKRSMSKQSLRRSFKA